ncbi:alpha/beta hydrolase [Streptomyces sp. NPDC089919]|uniref:alpha/beta fold hydrolase n=1 Tax=Streptomyces sp. NPDC089919 TaxID=3155188 RepID=UPI003441E1CD
MATYVLIPGADGRAWYWHLVAAELRTRGHQAVPVDLPYGRSDGLEEHVDAVLAAMVSAPLTPHPLVLVAQSLAGFVAPLVCARVPVDALVLVNAMVPAPGESAGEWWEATGQPAARAALAAREGRDPDAPFDLRTDFFHDVPEELTAQALAAGPAGPPEAIFIQHWPLTGWPPVPTRFIQGREDRFFPLDFQRRLVAERLGITVEEAPGGHLLALSRPRELADLLAGPPA